MRLVALQGAATVFHFRVISIAAKSLVLVGVLAAMVQAQIPIPNLFPFPNGSGILQTYSTAGNGIIDTTGPFFQSLGTNGRSCFSCHRPDQGWSVSAQNVALRFLLTQGTDPIFRTVDGSNCDHNIDVSTLRGRIQAFSLLTSRGLIRVALPVPSGAEYQVLSVANQYGCGDSSTISTYRRPLPSTNLKFLSAVMWDGRESTAPSTVKVADAATLAADLAHQAMDAVAGHAEGAVPLSPQVQQQIAAFESALYTAQGYDYNAGSLNAYGATGGPQALSTQQFFIGINDPLGGNPTGAPFTPAVFNLFTSWLKQEGFFGANARSSIQRGEQVFNTKMINITGVAGLNDALGVPVIQGNCATCHSTPNSGDHSVSLPVNIGVADLTNSLGVGYLPVVTLKNNTTGAIIQTTDPGRALITGKWEDVGKFKGPILRGLASRAPYFHNGSATSLGDVVDFYNARFGVGFTAQEKADLIAFLNAL